MNLSLINGFWNSLSLMCKVFCMIWSPPLFKMSPSKSFLWTPKKEIFKTWLGCRESSWLSFRYLSFHENSWYDIFMTVWNWHVYWSQLLKGVLASTSVGSGGQLSTDSPFYQLCQCMIFWKKKHCQVCASVSVFVCVSVFVPIRSLAISGLDGGAWWRQETSGYYWQVGGMPCHQSARSGPA